MRTIIFALLVLIALPSNACDICNLYMRLGLNDFQSSVGLNYRSQWFEGVIFNENKSLLTRHFDEQEIEQFQGSRIKEIYSNFELNGEYFFNEKISVSGFLPFRNVKRTVDDVQDIDYNKVGDPTVLANIRILNTKSSELNNFFVRLVLSGGVKFPLGSTKVYANNRYLNPDLQAGSGSYDLIAGIQGILSLKKFGLNSNLIFRKPFENLSGYVFGNSYSTQHHFFYIFQKNNIQFIPNFGYYTEYENSDHNNGEYIDGTKSNRSFLSFGGELVVKNVSLSGWYQENVSNKFSGIQIPAKNRVVFAIKYFIKQR